MRMKNIAMKVVNYELGDPIPAHVLAESEALTHMPDFEVDYTDAPPIVDSDTGVRPSDYPSRTEAYAAARSKRKAKVEARAQALDFIDVRTIRTRLKFTQEGFARTFGLNLRTVQEWEAGRQHPDATARVLLAVIFDNFHAVIAALDHAPRIPHFTADSVPAKRNRSRKEKVTA